MRDLSIGDLLSTHAQGAIFFVAGIVHVVSLVLGGTPLSPSGLHAFTTVVESSPCDCAFLGTIGRLMLRIVNLIYMVMTLLLLVFTLFFALIAGAIDSINTEYDLNFAEIRKSVEKVGLFFRKNPSRFVFSSPGRNTISARGARQIWRIGRIWRIGASALRCSLRAGKARLLHPRQRKSDERLRVQASDHERH